MKTEIRCNDNLEELKKIPSDSVDLVYIDPPFNTGKHQGDYDDRFDSMNDYLTFMKPRLQEIHRVLKNDGTFYLHADHHASHHLRMMLDDIFGEKNFGNEIVWYYGGPSPAKRNFPRKHDAIFRYMKGKDFTFNPQREPYGKNHNIHVDDDGRTWMDQHVGNISDAKFDELKRDGRNSDLSSEIDTILDKQSQINEKKEEIRNDISEIVTESLEREIEAHKKTIEKIDILDSEERELQTK